MFWQMTSEYEEPVAVRTLKVPAPLSTARSRITVTNNYSNTVQDVERFILKFKGVLLMSALPAQPLTSLSKYIYTFFESFSFSI